MRGLTANRIAEAQAAHGNAGKLATAISELAKGDSLVIANKLDKGIESYGSSWNELSGAF